MPPWAPGINRDQPGGSRADVQKNRVIVQGSWFKVQCFTLKTRSRRTIIRFERRTRNFEQSSPAFLMKPKIVIILGPTAVGKTELALSLAERINAEIVNGDSQQVYPN